MSVVYTEPAKKNLHFWIMSEDVAEEALLVALKAFSVSKKVLYDFVNAIFVSGVWKYYLYTCNYNNITDVRMAPIQYTHNVNIVVIPYRT